MMGGYQQHAEGMGMGMGGNVMQGGGGGMGGGGMGEAMMGGNMQAGMGMMQDHQQGPYGQQQYAYPQQYGAQYGGPTAPGY